MAASDARPEPSHQGDSGDGGVFSLTAGETTAATTTAGSIAVTAGKATSSTEAEAEQSSCSCA